MSVSTALEADSATNAPPRAAAAPGLGAAWESVRGAQRPIEWL